LGNQILKESPMYFTLLDLLNAQNVLNMGFATLCELEHNPANYGTAEQAFEALRLLEGRQTIGKLILKTANSI
jgi:hypothetical protein